MQGGGRADLPDDRGDPFGKLLGGSLKFVKHFGPEGRGDNAATAIDLNALPTVLDEFDGVNLMVTSSLPLTAIVGRLRGGVGGEGEGFRHSAYCPMRLVGLKASRGRFIGWSGENARGWAQEEPPKGTIWCAGGAGCCLEPVSSAPSRRQAALGGLILVL